MTVDLPPAPAVLRAAADLLDANPELWGRDYWRDPATSCRCSGGLIALVIAPNDTDGDPYGLPGDGTALALAAIELFEAHVRPELEDRFGPDGVHDAAEPLIGLWNDRVARDAAHVAETMRTAAGGTPAAQRKPIFNDGVTVEREGKGRFAVHSKGNRWGHFRLRRDAETFAEDIRHGRAFFSEAGSKMITAVTA